MVLQYHNSKNVRWQVWSYAHLPCFPPFLYLSRTIVHHWNSVKPLKLGTKVREFKIHVNSIVRVHVHIWVYVTKSSNSLQRCYYSEGSLYTSQQKSLFPQYTWWCRNDAEFTYDAEMCYHIQPIFTLEQAPAWFCYFFSFSS